MKVFVVTQEGPDEGNKPGEKGSTVSSFGVYTSMSGALNAISDSGQIMDLSPVHDAGPDVRTDRLWVRTWEGSNDGGGADYWFGISEEEVKGC